MINIPKGTKDVLPQESFKWQQIRRNIEQIAKIYNLKEITTPVFEHTELFVRGVGESTDIVNKEMYTFLDKGNRSLTLRPEGTAPVVRSFIENGMFNNAMPIKLFYLTPSFRYEKPQSGRLRQHTQFGVEIFGPDSYLADGEAILIMDSFYKSLSLSPTFVLNTIGCEEDRKSFKAAFKKYVEPKIHEYCTDCKRRYHQNPLRMLDCKSSTCKKLVEDAPKLSQFLCDKCSNSFNNLKNLLTQLKINFIENNKLVRGFDYYTGVVFEVILEGVDYAMGGGGRYNNLVEELGGNPTAVVGFGIGIERVLLYLENNNIDVFKEDKPNIYIASATENMTYIFKFVEDLRLNGIACEFDKMDRSLKAQFKYADKLEVDYVLVIGDDEINSKIFTLKNMKTGEHSKFTKDELIAKLK